MISFDEAFAKIAAIARPFGEEDIVLAHANGRILAKDIVARSNAPFYDVSAMDGYGVKDKDIAALPARLPVTRESFAGSPMPDALKDGECIRIFTGAPVPQGVDRVVIQENVTREDDIAIISEAQTGKPNIRKSGSDFHAGDTLLSQGDQLNWRKMTAAAAADRDHVSVYRRIKAVVLTTGDELKAPGQAHLTPGAIPESVSYGVAAFLSENGVDVLRTQRLVDDLDTLKASANEALADADLVVVTGGASVGERDYAKAMFEDHAPEQVFSKVAMKPGKPVWLSKVRRSYVMGLPGNPSSALVTARLLLQPLVFGLSGLTPEAALAFEEVTCLDDLPQGGDREEFMRARRTPDGITICASQDSGSQITLADANILIRRPPNAPAVKAGGKALAISF